MRGIQVQYAAAPAKIGPGQIRYAIASSFVNHEGGYQMIKRATDVSFFFNKQSVTELSALDLILNGCSVGFVIQIDSTQVTVIRSFETPADQMAKIADQPGEYEDGGSW